MLDAGEGVLWANLTVPTFFEFGGVVWGVLERNGNSRPISLSLGLGEWRFKSVQFITIVSESVSQSVSLQQYFVNVRSF